MKKRLFWAALLLCVMAAMSGCVAVIKEEGYVESKAEPTENASASSVIEASATDAQTEEAPAASGEETAAETAAEEESDIVWGESYTSPEDVAEYIYLYGELPENFITKNEARDMGWESSEGNLWEVAPGMSIGGDYFGNYEGLLPEGKYRECDVNFDGGYRGAERIIYGEDGSIYYTDDHYESFTQLY